MDNYRYYIDGVLQAYVPTPPDPSAKLTLDSVAAIGHPDTIDRENRDFKVWSVALDGTEVKASSDAVVTYENVTHNGEQIVHNGEQVYTTN